MFPHKDNIESKISSNYKGKLKVFENFYNKFYIPWYEANIKITGINIEDIKKKVILLNNYYSTVDTIMARESGITSQSKFRPTVLEEFCFYLLKDLREIKILKLVFLRKGIHAGFRLDSHGNITCIKKDVDCCITKREDGLIGQKKIQFIIPIVSIECKTYLDATMWNEGQYTAILLKRANPTSKVYIFTETNQVDLDKITKESPVNEIFAIRKSYKDRIEFDVIFDFFRQVQNDLKEILSTEREFVIGRVINR